VKNSFKTFAKTNLTFGVPDVHFFTSSIITWVIFIRNGDMLKSTSVKIFYTITIW